MSKEDSLRDPIVIFSIADFVNLQRGDPTDSDLHKSICRHVHERHQVEWEESDVKNVLRAAGQRGSAIEKEEEKDKRIIDEYEQAMHHINTVEGLRSDAHQQIEVSQPIIERYNQRHTHHRTPLSHAQLALHHALRALTERRKRSKAETKSEEERAKQSDRKEREDHRKEEQSRKAAKKKEEKEKVDQKEMELKRRQDEEQRKTRAINTHLVKALTESNKERYRKRRREADERAEFIRLGNEIMKRFLATTVQTEEAAEKKAVENEKTAEDKANTMPL